jgi:hypothetical protein
MDIKTVHKQLEFLIEAIQEQHAELKSNTGRIPRIELDLIRKNIMELYEFVHYLGNLNESVSEKKSIVEIKVDAERPEPIINPVIVENRRSELASETDEVADDGNEITESVSIQNEQFGQIDSADLEKTTVIIDGNSSRSVDQPKPADEPLVEIESGQNEELIGETEKVTPELNENPVGKEEVNQTTFRLDDQHTAPGKGKTKTAARPGLLFDDIATVAEKFEDKPSLHDRLTQARQGNDQGSFAEEFRKKSVTLLKASIGINDKFLFVNELFGGDMKAYLDCIDTLDNFSGFNEAEAFIHNKISKEFGWEVESKASDIFMKFVTRRFQD